MPIYLLTNKVTHARCVVSADTAEKAIALHPTSEYAIRGPRGWYKLVGMAQAHVPVPRPTDWPVRLDLVHADLLARRAESAWEGLTAVLAYQPDSQLRQLHEGPDDSWGGYDHSMLENVDGP